MKYQVRLRLFQDDATGDWGLAHANAIDINTPFNAFWTPQGIFHDVFEHYFEDTHKYFSDQYAFNIGGEVAAMGHYAYYIYNFHPQGRLFNRGYNYSSIDELVIGGTISEMQEAIEYSSYTFGDQLLCRVPPQKLSDYNLDNIIYEHHAKVKDFKPGKEDDWNIMGSKQYKRSVTLGRLANLYRWGWKQAEKIAPRTTENFEIIDDFLEFWAKFVEYNNAEELAQVFKEVGFVIKGGEKLSWQAKWLTHDNQIIKGKVLDIMEEAYSLPEIY